MLQSGQERQFREALISSSDDEARSIIWKAKEDLKLTRLEIIERYVVPALDSIGADWHEGELALSQVYVSGRICENIINELLPEKRVDPGSRPGIGLVVLNDHHALGKRIVSSVLKAGGYSLIDYGIMSAGQLFQRIREDNPALVMVSVLMLSSALEVKNVISNLADCNCSTKIAVGGAPFRLDRQLWLEVGADAVGFSAADSLKIAEQYLGGVE